MGCYFFRDPGIKAGSLALQAYSLPSESPGGLERKKSPNQLPLPFNWRSWNSAKNCRMRSEGIAKEIPAVTFNVFMPITSPSCQRRGHCSAAQLCRLNRQRKERSLGMLRVEQQVASQGTSRVAGYRGDLLQYRFLLRSLGFNPELTFFFSCSNYIDFSK